jgi:hypothetical protein
VFAAAVALTPGLAYASAPAAGTASAPAVGHTAAVKPTPSSVHAFSSPASASFRAQQPALADAKNAATIAAATAARAGKSGAGKTGAGKSGGRNSDAQATTPIVIYTGTGPGDCSVDTGTGTQANPYCSVQDAVNAAAPGDTIEVTGDTGYSSNTPVKVTTSDISIVGIGGQAWLDTDDSTAALTLDGVTGVTVSNMMLTSYGGPTVDIVGSSGITIDSSYVIQEFPVTGGVDSVAIDGGSSGITLSRTYLDTGGWTAGSDAVAVASGASDIDLASDVLSDSGIVATGVNGLDVTGDTVQRGCSSGIDIEGASTGVSLENNLLEDAVAGADSTGTPASCNTLDQPWAPDVTVSTDASAGTTADYNDFYAGTDTTDPYSWAGTAYPTLAAFRSGATQGAHDTTDTVAPSRVNFRANQWSGVDALLGTGSAAINSANPDAPGALKSDFYGTSPYTARGAIQYLSLNPTLAVGLSGEDTSAYGISLKATIHTDTSATVFLTVSWGDGTTTQSDATGTETDPLTHEYSALGVYTVTATLSDTYGNVVTNSGQAETAGSDYFAYGPTRVLDTRSGNGAPKAKVAAHGTVHLAIVGGSIPKTATAAVLNVTVTNPTQTGYITAYPDGGTRPTTSNVNFVAKQTVPNQVIAPIGSDGKIALYNGSPGTVDLIADISGYFGDSPGSGYTAITPYRLVDSRNGTGKPRGQLGGQSSFAAQVAGNDHGVLPGSGITAVALNVTSVGARSAGYFTVYPDGTSLPTTSNVSFSWDQTIANSVIVPVGKDGKIRIYNGGWNPSDVVVDVVGYYSAASRSAYLPMEPTRYLDTRSKTTWKNGPLRPGWYIYMPISNGYPDVTSFVLNTTVTDTRGRGYLSVTPDPNSLQDYQNGWETYPPKPSTSTLNWTEGQTVPNLVQAGTGSYGVVDFWNNSTGNLDLIVDAFGYYQND